MKEDKVVAPRPNGNGLGPVAREKYEAILQARVRRCMAAQEAIIKARRPDALGTFLEKNGLVGKIAAYRAALDTCTALRAAQCR